MWKIAGGFASSAAAELQSGGDGHVGFHSPTAHPHGLGFPAHDAASPLPGDGDHLDVWHGGNSPLGGADGDDHGRHGLLPLPVSRGLSRPTNEMMRPAVSHAAATFMDGPSQAGSVDFGAVRGGARAHVRAVDLSHTRAPKRHHTDLDHEFDAYRTIRPRMDHQGGQQQLHDHAATLDASLPARYGVDDRLTAAVSGSMSGYHFPMSTPAPVLARPYAPRPAAESAFAYGSAVRPSAPSGAPAAGSPGPAPGGDSHGDERSGVDVVALLTGGSRRHDTHRATSSSSATAGGHAKPSGDGDVPSALVAAAHRLQQREQIDVLHLRGTSSATKPSRAEEEDDDDEDDEDQLLPGGSARRQEARERRRQRKNDRERRRRQEVGDAMDDLAEVVGVLTGTQRRNKSDKVTVLQAALRSIRGLTEGLRAVSTLARTADPAACAPVVSEETAGIMTAALSGVRR